MIDTIRKANARVGPQKIVVYGVKGIGKTTFGATFPDPILLRIEDGADAVDVNTFPDLVTDYQGVVNAISALHEEHPYKTLIVDSLDALEPLVWEETCRIGGKESIEEFGYGKGYVESDKRWRMLMGGFDSLRASKGMHIVLLAHSEIKHIEPPDSDAYDRYQMRLHKRAFNLWTEWAGILLFMNYKIAIRKEKKEFKGERSLAIGSGDRIIYTTERPAWDAKNRWKLPDDIYIGKDETYAAFHAELEKGTGGAYTNPAVTGTGSNKKTS